MEKCLFAYNPQSGKGKIAKKERYILDTLSKKFDVTLLHSQYAGHIGKYILENGELYDTIVISGGDGTLNEAINSIARLNKKITIIVSLKTFDKRGVVYLYLVIRNATI